MDTLAWVSWIVGGVLALLGLVVAAWSIRGDRSRGRRRCPKCWYDMSRVPGMTCPECGRTANRERKFSKTRRRWKGVACAGLLVMLGMIAAVTPAAYTGKWVKYTPTPVLKVVVDQFGSDSETAFAIFVQSNNGTNAVANLSSWEKLLLASECARKLATFQSIPLKQRAALQDEDGFRLSSNAYSLGMEWAARRPEWGDSGFSEQRVDWLNTCREAYWATSLLSTLGDESCMAGDELLNLIADGDADCARFALLVIEGLNTSGEYLTPGLVHIFQTQTSESTRVNAIVAVALVSSPPDEDLRSLLLSAIKEDDSYNVRVAAMYAMATIDPENESLHQCLARLATGDALVAVREHALTALAQIFGATLDRYGGTFGLLRLAPGLSSYWSSPLSVINAIMTPRTIGPTNDARFVPICINILNDSEARLRTTSASYLDSYGTDARSAIPAIDAALTKETDPEAKFALLEAYLHVEAGPRSVQRIAEALDDPSISEGTVRWVFVELERLGPHAAAAVPALERFITTHGDTLVYSIDTLARIGDAAMPVLLKLLQDPRDGVRFMVATSLSSPGSSNCGVIDQLIPWMKDANPAVRVYIAKTLVKCPEQWDRVFPAMVEALHNEGSVSARMEYVELLAKFGENHLDEMVPQLAVSLADDSWQVRLVSAQQLAALGKDAQPARAALDKATHDSDEAVRSAALSALEKLEGR